MQRRIIEQDLDVAEDDHPWTLAVERGDDVVRVVARRIVPYDDVLTYSTEDRAASSKRSSQYGLDARTVVKRYAARSASQTPFETLIDDVQVALAELRGEEVEA